MLSKLEIYAIYALSGLILYGTAALFGIWGVGVLLVVALTFGVIMERIKGEPLLSPEEQSRREYLRQNNLPPDPIIIRKGWRGLVKEQEGMLYHLLGFGLIAVFPASMTIGVPASVAIGVCILGLMFGVYLISVSTEDITVLPHE